jgi:hypothetical protein
MGAAPSGAPLFLPSALNVQLRQRLFEFSDAIVGDLGVVEMQGYELIESSETNEAGVRNLRVSELLNG